MLRVSTSERSRNRMLRKIRCNVTGASLLRSLVGTTQDRLMTLRVEVGNGAEATLTQRNIDANDNGVIEFSLAA